MDLEEKKKTYRQELRPLLEDEYFILDTDTTDLEPGEICRISVMNHNKEIVFDSFLKIENEVSLGAFQMHQLTKEQLKDEPIFRDVYAELNQLLSGKNVFIYNKYFDLMFLRAAYRQYNLQPIEFNAVCAMEFNSLIYTGDTSTYFKLTMDHEILKNTIAKLHCTFDLLNLISR